MDPRHFQRRDEDVVVADDAAGVVHQPSDSLHSGFGPLASQVPPHRPHDRGAQQRWRQCHAGMSKSIFWKAENRWVRSKNATSVPYVNAFDALLQKVING